MGRMSALENREVTLFNEGTNVKSSFKDVRRVRGAKKLDSHAKDFNDSKRVNYIKERIAAQSAQSIEENYEKALEEKKLGFKIKTVNGKLTKKQRQILRDREEQKLQEEEEKLLANPKNFKKKEKFFCAQR